MLRQTEYMLRLSEELHKIKGMSRHWERMPRQREDVYFLKKDTLHQKEDLLHHREGMSRQIKDMQRLNKTSHSWKNTCFTREDFFSQKRRHVLAEKHVKLQ